MVAEAGGGGSSTQYLYISGNIWIDEKSNKKDEYDGIYSSNTEDLYKQSVKVSLINSSGTTVRTETTTNGTYNINTGIAISSSTSNASIQNSLSGYYLKFEYSDKYTLVSPNFEKENGSKALSGIGEEDNNEVIEDGIGYIYNLSGYVDSFYSYKTLAHMNMGVIKAENPDYEITQNIAYVKVVINGHTYTYEYGGSGDTTKTAAPTVRWQNSYAYTRTIYPSDIAYGNNNENSLNVYVVYRIDVTNTNNTNTQYGKTKTTQYGYVSYVEIDLQVTSLTNEYDTNRYELETENDKNKNKDFGNWEASNGIATYKGNKFDKGIDAKDTETVYIQFKVKKEALNDLFSKEEIYEKQPTIATVYAYHDYWRTYRKWSKTRGSYLVSRYKTTEKFEKTASAYYLRLMLNTERIITGTVFEDENVYLNGEVLGDGMFGNKPDGSKENTIDNVKVDLISKDGNPAILYSSSNKYEAKQATTTSSQDGTYTFVGVTPGKYYVRFTYGDGNQKIFKPDGTEAGTVSINDYKSTVATDACIQTALGYELEGVKSSEEWYKHEKHSTNKANILYSTATDNLTQRAEYNQDNNSRTNIEASTALMSIGLENTQDNIATVTKTFEDDIIKEKILGINFGIIDIPEISLAFDKVVSNIKITNAQGNILAEGNPATKNIKYVNDLDKGDHLVEGSQHTKSEIKEQELYGSTLKLEYSITVQNNSEVNFYEANSSKYYGYYYMFGDSTTSDSKEVTITIDNVLDFIDPSIKWENTSIDDKHKIAQVKASDNQTITDNIQAKTSLTYEYLVDITEWNKLYTTKNKDKNYSKDKTQDTAVLTVIKLLSTNADDFGVSNVAQVTKLHVTDTPALIEIIDASETYFNDSKYVNPTEEVYAIITPPTGEDKLTTIIYVIVEIVALSAITAGVVLIKKKVLDK